MLKHELRRGGDCWTLCKLHRDGCRYAKQHGSHHVRVWLPVTAIQSGQGQIGEQHLGQGNEADGWSQDKWSFAVDQVCKQGSDIRSGFHDCGLDDAMMLFSFLANFSSFLYLWALYIYMLHIRMRVYSVSLTSNVYKVNISGTPSSSWTIG